MTQHGGGPTGEHRGDPPRLRGENTVANCVDAAVDGVQPTPLQAVIDGSRAEPDVEQLRSPDYPVLATRQFGDHSIDATSSQFSPYCGVKCDLVRHLGRFAPEPARVTSRTSRIRGRTVSATKHEAQFAAPGDAMNRGDLDMRSPVSRPG
jgi:hypothetical protein